MDWDYGEPEVLTLGPEPGLFILNQGNFQYGNASLSFYAPGAQLVENQLFFRANKMKLGDVAQSAAWHDGKLWVVVNNSHVIFALDGATCEELGRIEGLTSPRYLHFLSDCKAYVTQLWDNRIAVVNPETFKIESYIQVPGQTMQTGSTEQMAQVGDTVYVCCWSYQNKVVAIDTRTDRVVEELEVGIQPRALVADLQGDLWTLTDGGHEGSPYGTAWPELVQLGTQPLRVKRRLGLSPQRQGAALATNARRDTLYWINGDVWRMAIDSDTPEAVIPADGTIYFGLTVSPHDADIYVADAIDYMQQGVVRRYDRSGKLKDKFKVGVIPGAFCWKPMK